MVKVFILVHDLLIHGGGMTRAMLNRSTMFTEHGYDVDFITFGDTYNYPKVESELKKMGRMKNDVGIININDYLLKKNTLNRSASFKHHIFKIRNNLSRKKMENKSHDGRINKLYKKSNGEIEKTFSSSGFCFLEKKIDSSGQIEHISIFNEMNGSKKTFETVTEYYASFLDELCSEQTEKPFLICDGPGSIPKALAMNPKSAYRIYHVHTNHFLEPYSFGSPIKENHLPLFESLPNIEAMVILTKKQAEDVINQFGDYKNIYVIPNFIPETDMHLKNSPKTKKNKITLFSRYTFLKGVGDAINAFKIVSSQRPDAKLEIFGNGPRKKNFQKQIKELGLENNVFLKGYVNNVNKEMAESVATLLTSKYEAFSLVIMESLLNKTPAISFDVNYGPSDIIDHSKNGFLVEPYNIKEMAEKIIFLLDYPLKADEMGKNGREKILAKYSQQVIFKKWEKLFFDILKKNS